MRIHHLNCATMRPRGGRLVTGRPQGKLGPVLVAHCLLIEAGEGLVLVDSGFGLADVRQPKQRVSGALRFAGRPAFDERETAIRQVEALGFQAADVRHIVLTHLDIDHTGGISDFPHAHVHVFAPEHDAAMARRTRLERSRYQPAHWAHGPHWVRHEPTAGEGWFGFECVRRLEGLPPEVLLVPVTGHTRGHCAIAVDTGRGWLLHCGDAYFHHGEMERPHHCPGGLSLFQTVVQMDKQARLANQERLRELAAAQATDVQLFSAHDAWEFERLAEGVAG